MAGLDPAIYRGTQMAGSKPGHDMNIGNRFLVRSDATRQSRAGCATVSRLPRRFAPRNDSVAGGIVLGMHTFGSSAPITVVAEHFGCTADRVVVSARQAVAKPSA